MSARREPRQLWWTPAELAASGLPELPRSRQGVDQIAARDGWRAAAGKARRRPGRGGGWEYHWTLLPLAARAALTRAEAPAAVAAEPVFASREDAWAWFERLPEAAQQAARERLALIARIEALEAHGSRQQAVRDVARLSGLGARTLWSWLGRIGGQRGDDRLPFLAPRHRGAARRDWAECAVEAMDWLKSAYLRPAGQSFAQCYRLTAREAARRGWALPPERTMRRHFEAEVSEATRILARKGLEALKRRFPPQVRDKTALVALEAVNGDFHRFDVFVRWPGRRGEAPVILRPQMVAFQDVFSGRILAWRVDVSANSTAVLLAAGDMIETWGIPGHVLLDNGHEFAAKSVTGGVATRYRFKVRKDDIPGLFTALGCEIHWATPYAGQSKPIERAFRDMCDAIARDPRFDGAWTGNRPDAKPEDYGSRAVDLEYFLKVLAEGIEEHNTRTGRRSEVAFGRSFAEVFDESYAQAPIRRATEAQRRFCLLGAEGLRASRQSGEIGFAGNRFWSDWMAAIAGQPVIVRFDPADFWSGLHVYSADNRYLGHAACIEKAGFFDQDEAQAHARARNAWLAAERKALAAHRVLSAREIAADLDAQAPLAALPPPEARVVRPIFGAGPAARAVPAAPVPADLRERTAVLVADFAAARGRERQDEAEEGPRQRFRRALDLERRQEAGAALTAEQGRWLAAYRASAEYRGERALWEDFGDTVFR